MFISFGQKQVSYKLREHVSGSGVYRLAVTSAACQWRHLTRF